MADDEEQDDAKLSSPFKYLLMFGVVSLVVGIAWWRVTMWFVHEYHGGKGEEAQQLAESFGAVNALFSALAFGGVIITLWMQREELELQRREIRASRIAQEKSEKALSKQAQWLFDAAYLYALNQLRTSYPPVTRTTHKFYMVTDAKFQGLIEAIVGHLEESGSVLSDAWARAAALSLCIHVENYAKAFPKVLEKQARKDQLLFLSTFQMFVESLPRDYPFPDRLKGIDYDGLQGICRAIDEAKDLQTQQDANPDDARAKRIRALFSFVEDRMHEWAKETLHKVEVLAGPQPRQEPRQTDS
jgi:hypothetical protein